MVMTANKRYDWPNYLQKLIDNYNNSVHFTTKETPNKLHEKHNKQDLEIVEKRIRKKVSIREEADKPKFNENDMVRMKIDPDDRDKYGQTFSRKLYQVDKVYKPRSTTSSVSYILFDPKTNELLNKKYYNNDLQLVKSIENPIIEDANVYEVSRLVEPVLLDGEKAYKVAWKGYRKKPDQKIQLRSQLLQDIPKMVKQYENNNAIDWDEVDKYDR